MFLPINEVISSNMPMLVGDLWDRQTIVIKVLNDNHMNYIASILHKNREPQSRTQITNGLVSEGYVNLNYSINEKDPSNRNVRLIYAIMDKCTDDEIISRFQGAYIFCGISGTDQCKKSTWKDIEERMNNYATSRISGKIS